MICDEIFRGSTAKMRWTELDLHPTSGHLVSSGIGVDLQMGCLVKAFLVGCSKTIPPARICFAKRMDWMQGWQWGEFCAHGDKHIYSFQFLCIQVPWQIFSSLFPQASLVFKQHYILALDYALNMSMYRNIARLVLRLCLWFDVSVTWCFSMQRQNICTGLRVGSVRHNMRATGQQ